MNKYILLFNFLFLSVSSLVSYPVRYTELINPQTKQHVHIIGDLHVARKNISATEINLLKVIKKSDGMFPLRVLIEEEQGLPLRWQSVTEGTFLFIDNVRVLLNTLKLTKTEFKAVDYRPLDAGVEMLRSYNSAIIKLHENTYKNKLFKFLITTIAGYMPFNADEPYVSNKTFQDVYNTIVRSKNVLEKHINDTTTMNPKDCKQLKEDIKGWWDKYNTIYSKLLTTLNAQPSDVIYTTFAHMEKFSFFELIESLYNHVNRFAEIGFIYAILSAPSDCILYCGDAHAEEVARDLQKRFGFSKVREKKGWFSYSELPPQTWQYIYKDHEMIQVYKMREAAALAH